MIDQKHDEPLLEKKFTVEGGDFIRAGEVSSKIKKMLKEIGVSHEVIRRTAIVTYEAEMNVVCHAKRGKFHLVITPERISVVIQDEGEGIENVDLAMKQGFSTANSKIREMGFGAGMGLPNIKKNVDELSITSVVGEGTRVEMVIFIR